MPSDKSHRPTQSHLGEPGETQALDATFTGSTSDETRQLSRLAIGRKFGRYTILRMVAEGGMGAVYVAQDSQLDRQVALKVPKFRRLGRDEAALLVREARAAAALNHPNICHVFDVGQINGIPYITMAFIEGISLSSLLKRNGQIPQLKAAVIIRKLAAALHEAHRQGVVHRDLKPSNIIISRKGEPIITDFGLALRMRSAPVDCLEGTPWYMAPEQILGLDNRDERLSDVFSLGVILFELISGRRPFDGGRVQDVFHSIVHDETPELTNPRCDVDTDIATICHRALDKRPESRFENMQALSNALTDYITSRNSPEQNTESAGNRGHSRTARWAFLGSVAVFMAAVAWIAVRLTPEPKQSAPQQTQPAMAGSASPDSTAPIATATPIESPTDYSAIDEPTTEPAVAAEDESARNDAPLESTAAEPVHAKSELKLRLTPAATALDIVTDAEFEIEGTNDSRTVVLSGVSADGTPVTLKGSAEGYAPGLFSARVRPGGTIEMELQLVRERTESTQLAIDRIFDQLWHETLNDFEQRGPKVLRGGRAADVDRSEIRYAYSLCALHSSCWSIARRTLQDLIDELPDVGRPRIALAHALAAENDYSTAIEVLHDALTVTQSSTSVVEAVAMLVTFAREQPSSNVTEDEIRAIEERILVGDNAETYLSQASALAKSRLETARLAREKPRSFTKDLLAFEDRVDELKTAKARAHQTVVALEGQIRMQNRYADAAKLR